MPTSFSAQDINIAQKHLRKVDPIMKSILKRVGPFKLRLQRNRFETLIKSIVSQQVSVASARSVLQEFRDSLEPDGMQPEVITKRSFEQLKAVGLSKQKATYISDLANKVANNEVKLSQLGRLADEKVIEQLTQVKGIGVWTAQMFLIFSLGRLDVLPVDDLAVRSAIQKQYKLDEHPTKSECVEIGQAWKPYSSVASWYLWRSTELND